MPRKSPIANRLDYNLTHVWPSGSLSKPSNGNCRKLLMWKWRGQRLCLRPDWVLEQGDILQNRSTKQYNSVCIGVKVIPSNLDQFSSKFSLWRAGASQPQELGKRFGWRAPNGRIAHTLELCRRSTFPCSRLGRSEDVCSSFHFLPSANLTHGMKRI